MVKYEQYKKDGQKYYKVKGYLGRDAVGKQVNLEKRGFKTKKRSRAIFQQG